MRRLQCGTTYDLDIKALSIEALAALRDNLTKLLGKRLLVVGQGHQAAWVKAHRDTGAQLEDLIAWCPEPEVRAIVRPALRELRVRDTGIIEWPASS